MPYEQVKIRAELKDAQGVLQWWNWIEGPNNSRTFNRLVEMFRAQTCNETFRMNAGDTITFTCEEGES
jgi:hypothetical protein